MVINKKIIIVTLFCVTFLFFVVFYLLNNNFILVDDSRKLEVERISKKYYKIDNLKVIGNKIAYRVTLSPEEVSKFGRSFIIYDGKEIGREYYRVGDFIEIGGNFCYRVYEETSTDFWVCDGVEYGKGYRYVYDPVNINGKPAFLVTDSMHKLFIIYDDKKFGDGYDYVGSPIEIDGNLSYVAKKDNFYFLVKNGEETGNKYPVFFNVKKIKNDLVYEYSKEVYGSDSYANFLIDVNGINVVENYDYVYSGSFFNIDNKIVYSALKGDEYNIIYDGVNIYREKIINKTDSEKNSSRISRINLVNYLKHATSFKISSIDNKLIYVSQINNKSIINYDGKEIGKEYDSANYPTEINGKLTYIAKNGDKTFIVYDGKEIGKEYDSVNHPNEINGKLMYISKKDDKSYIIYNNKEIKISNNHSFDNIFNQGKEIMYFDGKDGKTFTNYIVNVNNKIVYVDEKDGKSFVVMEK